VILSGGFLPKSDTPASYIRQRTGCFSARPECFWRRIGGFGPFIRDVPGVTVDMRGTSRTSM
jgi:hypothetical protein